MSAIARNMLRLRSYVAPAKLGGVHQSARSLWATTSLTTTTSLGRAPAASLLVNKHVNAQLSCSCNFSTNAEKELVQFLAEEIVAEKKALKLKTIPTEFEGFKVSLDGAEVTLTKSQADEQITISFNVNHTVDMTTQPELDPRDDTPDTGDLKSKPEFDIDIKRGNQTLFFTCSYNIQPASGESDEYNDVFGIDRISLYEGEFSEKVYSVGGEIIDGYLYDLLMNYLEEKGISNEFAEKLVELSTSYEHTAYIGLLEGLSKFTKK